MKVCCVMNLFMGFIPLTHKLLNLQLNLISATFCSWTVAGKLNSHWPFMLQGHRKTTSNPERWGSRASSDRTACLSRAHPPCSASKNHCGESTEQLPAEMPDKNAGRQRICKRVNLFKKMMSWNGFSIWISCSSSVQHLKTYFEATLCSRSIA